ncbi:MAG: hypothetical protein FJ246_05280 [Nitrospira sp.]|nr:hypothetical protein [Nitrospira sp.]
MLRIGHRGAAGYVTENTLASIAKAVELGADLVELDVLATRDGRLVVFHDRRLDRLTTGKGLVAETVWADLRRLTVTGGHRIPTLEEAVAAAEGKVGLMLELKAQGIADQLSDAMTRIGFAGPLIYASFFHDDLQRLRRLQPKAHTLALIVGRPVHPATFALDAKATHVGIAFETLDHPYVETLHAAGIKVFAFTVNDPTDIQRMAQLGVDGIVSDFPDRISR